MFAVRHSDKEKCHRKVERNQGKNFSRFGWVKIALLGNTILHVGLAIFRKTLIQVYHYINVEGLQYLVNVEGEGSDSYPDHAFTVVKELDSFSVQREVPQMLKMR